MDHNNLAKIALLTLFFLTKQLINYGFINIIFVFFMPCILCSEELHIWFNSSFKNCFVFVILFKICLEKILVYQKKIYLVLGQIYENIL